MPNYCVSQKTLPGGPYEVHDLWSTHGCLPAPANRIHLGFHEECATAVEEARRYFSDVAGCRHCAPQCAVS